MPLQSPNPQVSTLFLSWQHLWTSLPALAAQVFAVTWYLRALGRARARGRPWPIWLTASFLVGMLVVAYGTEGGISYYERDNFTVHVVQVLLLADLAPVLLTAGAPVRLSLLASGSGRRSFALAVFHSPVLQLLTKPFVAFALNTAALYVYFMTPLYSLTERHPAFLVCVDLQFLLCGCLLWWVVVARDVLPATPPTGVRFALVLLCVPFDAYLGLEVGSVSKPLYAIGNTLSDTRAGGNVLWALAELFIVGALALLFVDWARDEERRAILADRQLDAAMAAARGIVDDVALAEGVPGKNGPEKAARGGDELNI
ncbi:MAG TPA: cytochrome c oxidase assembly protein [Acidimicrobiales bacterium]|nr:cytochrome c oxidase assembly protein [Acidimicrobiales bacterium]